MRPRERQETGEQDLFRSRLDRIIDLAHALVKLSRAIDWQFLEAQFGSVYSDGPGCPPLPTRLMAGLALLKHMYDLRALRLYIAHYFRSSAPRYGLVDPASRLAFRIERPRRSRKGSKKTEATVEIKPPVQDGINNPVVVRQDSNVQVISGKFLGDFQRHYDEKGYKIFDWVFETNPLAYFTALVGLSKIVRMPADVSHRGGSKPRSVDEILQRVEEQTGKEGRAAFEKFLAKVRPTE